MGCLYADALQRNGCPTTLVMRPGTSQDSLSLVVEQGNMRSAQQMRIITADDPAIISHLLVTTKAYDVRTAVASIAHLLAPHAVVLLLVNGMGLAEPLHADWPQLDVYCGTSTEGAYCVAPLHVRHAGRGETRIGRQGQQQPPPWFAQWAGAINPCVWDPHIETALWSKMAVNCVINPLTAMHHCQNGELARQPELAREVAVLCEEVARISSAAGFADVAAALPQTVSSVIAGTANNRSSMLQDVEKGQPTEIDYITGYLLQVADQHGIAAPHNRDLMQIIKSGEQKNP